MNPLAQSIQELQQDLVKSTVPIAELLRRAKLVAVMASNSDLLARINLELKGYSQEASLPVYRIVKGKIFATQSNTEILFKDKEIGNEVTIGRITRAATGLEDALKNPKIDNFALLIAEDSIIKIQHATRTKAPIQLLIGRGQVDRMLQEVRDYLLDESIVMMQDLGGLKVRPMPDMETTSSTTNIHQVFFGNVGNVASGSGATVEANIDFSIRNEAKDIISQLEALLPKSSLDNDAVLALKDSISQIKSELEADAVEKSKLKGLFHSIKSILEGAAGNIVAQGAIVLISHFLSR